MDAVFRLAKLQLRFTKTLYPVGTAATRSRLPAYRPVSIPISLLSTGFFL